MENTLGVGIMANSDEMTIEVIVSMYDEDSQIERTAAMTPEQAVEMSAGLMRLALQAHGLQQMLDELPPGERAEGMTKLIEQANAQQN